MWENNESTFKADSQTEILSKPCKYCHYQCIESINPKLALKNQQPTAQFFCLWADFCNLKKKNSGHYKISSCALNTHKKKQLEQMEPKGQGQRV